NLINIENEKLNEFSNVKNSIKIVLENENESILKYLIDNDVNINFKYEYEAITDYEYGIYDENLCDDKKCNTKLEIKTHLITLFEKENESWIQYLIEYGANVDCVNVNGINNNVDKPLFFAYEKQNETIVKILIEHGANVNVEGIKFEEICILSIKKILVEYGANINC
ncbi:hypothetical protein BCR32DRAFT_251734, partial [Anaeromyces robustus]